MNTNVRLLKKVNLVMQKTDCVARVNENGGKWFFCKVPKGS